MIAFVGGLASVYAIVAAYAVWTNGEYIWEGVFLDDGTGGRVWRIVLIGAALIAAPIAGAWIGLEAMNWLRPVRALDHRVRCAGRLASAGVFAGLLSVAGSAAAFPFAPAWLPEAAVTGGLSMVFSALLLLPFARRRVGHCIHCGYDLRGGALRATCPECGAVGSMG